MRYLGVKLFLLRIIPLSIAVTNLLTPVFLSIMIVFSIRSLISGIDDTSLWILQLSIWFNFVIFVYWLNFLFLAKLFLPIFYEHFLLSLTKKISLLQKSPILVFVLLVVIAESLTFISFAPPYRMYCLMVISFSFGLFAGEYLFRIITLKIINHRIKKSLWQKITSKKLCPKPIRAFLFIVF